MRKFTLLFAFLLSLMGVTQAQTVVTDLANLSNDKLYVLSTGRGTLQVNDAGNGLVAVETADNANPKQQFAVLKYSSDSYYLYHPLTQKCVSANVLGKPSVVKDAAAVTFVAHEPGGTASGKFVMKNGDNFYNMDNDRRLFVNGWSTHDDGNGFTITEVGDYGDADKVEGLFDWTATTAPQLSTAISPICYVIENLRSNKFAAHTLIGSALKQTTDITDAGAMWYFVDATDAVPDGVTLGEGVKAVYIRNLFSNLGLQSAVAATYADPGKIYYLIPHTVGDKSGFVISENTTVGVWTAWNERNGTDVCNYSGDDAGSLWSFYPALSSVKTQAQSGIPALVGSNLQSLKNSAIAEAEAEGARPYYACSEENVNACLATINAQAATTYEEYVTAKSNITNALSTLRATERVKTLQGGETIILENRNNPNNFLTSDAAEATATAAATLVNWGSTKDVKSLWTVVAVGDGTFKLCNALSGKYIQHQASNAQLTLTTAGEATAYEFTNQDLHYILLGAADSDTKGYHKYINWRDSNVISSWGNPNDKGNQWQVLQPSQELLNELASLQTPIETLKTAAKEEINSKTLAEINAGVEFYTITEEAFNTCKTEALALIEAATTHAELAEAKVQAQQLFDNLWTVTNNRANALTAGTKVKFLNKLVNTNYMTTDANGATTSSEVTTASVWELVANNEATGYYLYNNLSGKYLKHAAEDGGQATLVAKTEATLYNVQPKGAYVVMGEVEPGSNHSYVHCNNGTPFVTRWSDDDDRSLWTVTSATDDEISQLNTEIQTNITTQLDAAVAAADAVVNPYKALEYYKPQAAITTYDEDIAAAKDGVDTYEELAAALEAITAAKAAFETAVAADNVVLINTVGDGTQIKLRNRLHSEYWMSAIDGKVGMKSATDASSIWTLKAAADGGFYLLNPLTNKYVKHIDEDNTKFELVEGIGEASVYYVHPNGLYVTVGRSDEQSKATDSRDYLHGVNWNANGQWVVRWNAVGEASHWTLASVTEDEKNALRAAIEVEASAQMEAYKAEAQATVDAYAALPYFTATEAAVTAYNKAVAEIGEVTTYLGLSNGKARVDEALNAFLATDRSASNPVQDGDQIRLVNKQEPTFYMTTDANGVDAYADNSEANYVSSTIWTAVGNSTDGYKLYNPLKNRYIVHPTGNGVQAALVEDAAQATLYNIVPNGLYVNITLKEVGEEERPCLHYGTENHVTKFTADNDRSLWGISKATDEEKTQLSADIVAYVKATITAAQEEALRKANATDDFAYYACSAENVAIAVEAINAVSTEITTHEQLSAGLAAINAALETLYASERTAGPADGDLIRFINRYFTTHYLGYNSTGLAHYEPNTADDATENLPSTTIWQLEKSETEGQFYLKNYLLDLYACFETYNSNSQIVLRQEKNHPVKLIQKETIDGMWYFDIETQNTEVNGSYKSVHATNNGSTVQGHPDNYGSHWMITRATDEDLKSVNLTAQLSALIDFILKPVIEEAKRYYYVDAEGQVVNNFVDDVKAGYYTYTGDGTWDTYKESYVNDINRCISISENIGGTNSDQVHAAADVLRANIAKFSLNLPRTNGFFRLKCVYNDQYLQADANRQTFALNEETGKASIFYLEAKGNGDDANTSLGTLVSYDQGLYFTQGKSGGIYAKLQPIGTAGDTFSFTIPANNTFGSYNISSASGDNKRYLYGNAVERTEWQVIDGDSVEVKYYRADNGDNATVAIQGDTNNNGYNWILEEVEEIPVTINAYGYSTFFTPVALNIPEGVEASICTGIDENSDLVLQKLEGMILPYTAVILKAEALAGQDVYFTPASASDVMPLLEDENYLHGGVYKTWRKPECQNKNPEMTSATGTNANLPYLEEAADDKVYTLAKKNDKVAMYQYAGNKFTHFRAFLKLPAVVNANLAAVLNFAEIEEPTGIEEAPAISLEDAVIYDLSGRRVAEPGKGVYIVNGKKVYFK